MASYITVIPRAKPRCKQEFCTISEDVSCYIDVKIGPDILDPVRRLLKVLIKRHTARIDDQWNSGDAKEKERKHRDWYPDCEDCLAIDGVKKMIKRVAGRKL